MDLLHTHKGGACVHAKSHRPYVAGVTHLPCLGLAADRVDEWIARASPRHVGFEGRYERICGRRPQPHAARLRLHPDIGFRELAGQALGRGQAAGQWALMKPRNVTSAKSERRRALSSSESAKLFSWAFASK